MIPLARKTLIYEWRRFLPSALAVAFSGLLLLMQAALVFGIFGSAAVYINTSDADIWAGYPGTQSIELGRPIPPRTEADLLSDPAVQRVEPFAWIDGDWRGPADTGGVSVFVSGIDPRPDGMMFAKVLTPQQRALLREPGGVIVDAADLPKLGVKVGAQALINGQLVRIVGIGHGLRALGGVNVIASLDTARALDSDTGGTEVAYYVLKLKPNADVDAVAARLNAAAPRHSYAVWTGADFASRAVLYWMFETGAGLGVMFLAAVVFAVGAVITSQSLMAAVAGSVREYATLHALGVGFGSLRAVVLEQAMWIGLFGLLVGGIFSALLVVAARGQDVPVKLGISTSLVCAALVMAIALVSGIASLRTLRRVDPALLLR